MTSPEADHVSMPENQSPGQGPDLARPVGSSGLLLSINPTPSFAEHVAGLQLGDLISPEDRDRYCVEDDEVRWLEGEIYDAANRHRYGPGGVSSIYSTCTSENPT